MLLEKENKFFNSFKCDQYICYATDCNNEDIDKIISRSCWDQIDRDVRWCVRDRNNIDDMIRVDVYN